MLYYKIALPEYNIDNVLLWWCSPWLFDSDMWYCFFAEDSPALWLLSLTCISDLYLWLVSLTYISDLYLWCISFDAATRGWLFMVFLSAFIVQRLSVLVLLVAFRGACRHHVFLVGTPAVSKKVRFVVSTFPKLNYKSGRYKTAT